MLNNHVGQSWNRLFGVSYNNLPKSEDLFRQRWAQNYMGACFQAPHATPRLRLMEMHHVH